jgi:hypothetical protein
MAQETTTKETKRLVKLHEEGEALPQEELEIVDAHLKKEKMERIKNRLDGITDQEKKIFFNSFKDQLEVLVKTLKIPFLIPDGDFDYPYRTIQPPTAADEKKFGPVNLMDVISSMRNIPYPQVQRIMIGAATDLDPNVTADVAGFAQFHMRLLKLINFFEKQYNQLADLGVEVDRAYDVLNLFKGREEQEEELEI